MWWPRTGSTVSWHCCSRRGRALRSFGALIAIIAVWSFLTGVRNILQRQLFGIESDSKAGPAKVVHDRGHPRLQNFVHFGVLPPELLVIGTLAALTGPGSFVLLPIAAYLALEALRAVQNVIVNDVFSERSTRFIPFADDGICKFHGPVPPAQPGAGVAAQAPAPAELKWRRKAGLMG